MKGRIARITKSHRRGRYGYWVTQEKWEEERPENLPEDNVAERHWAAVGLDDATDWIVISVWSQHLIDAFKLVNKAPSLNSSLSVMKPEGIVEPWPFRMLFENMPALQVEIEKSENEEAILDLKALEAVIEESVLSDWGLARSCLKMNDGSVSFDTLVS